MGEPDRIGTGFGLGTDSLRLTTTSRSEFLQHIISDDELERLSTMRRNWASDAVWACVGLVGGTAKGAISAVYDRYLNEDSISMSFGNLVDIILFSTAFVLMIVLYIVNKTVMARTTDLVEEIRQRKGETVTMRLGQ